MYLIVDSDNYAKSINGKIKGSRRNNDSTLIRRNSSGFANENNVQLKRRRSAKELTSGFENTSHEEFDSQSLNDDDTSNIGRALSDLTSKWVIAGILVMVIIIPFLTLSIDDNSDTYALNQIHSNTGIFFKENFYI